VSKRVGPFSGHVNFFYKRPGTARLNDEISLLGGIEFSAAHNFNILSEIILKKKIEIMIIVKSRRVLDTGLKLQNTYILRLVPAWT